MYARQATSGFGDVILRMRHVQLETIAGFAAGNVVNHQEISSQNSLSSCQRFSIGSRLGLSWGVCHQLMLCSWENWRGRLEVCFGVLSCMKQWWSGKTSCRKEGVFFPGW